jgi:hypothetical protein
MRSPSNRLSEIYRSVQGCLPAHSRRSWPCAKYFADLPAVNQAASELRRKLRNDHVAVALSDVIDGLFASAPHRVVKLFIPHWGLCDHAPRRQPLDALLNLVMARFDQIRNLAASKRAVK